MCGLGTAHMKTDCEDIGEAVSLFKRILLTPESGL
jgi:hypothetical protein